MISLYKRKYFLKNNKQTKINLKKFDVDKQNVLLNIKKIITVNYKRKQNENKLKKFSSQVCYFSQKFS